MAKYKNQHYVPVFLLKNFDNDDEKTTNLWVIKSNQLIKKVSIKNQASEDNFYGNDKVVEQALGNLDQIFSQLVSDITGIRFLPSRNTYGHFILDILVLCLSSRTRYAGEVINEQIDKTMKSVLKHNPKYYEEINKIKIGIKNPASFSLSISLQSVHYIADMEHKLLENKTNVEFIISDNPVIKHNTFLRSKKWPGSHIGMASKGLQYFLPISPKYAIVLFDRRCYKVGNKKDKIIAVSNVNDINQINTMQLLNANEVLYFSQNFGKSNIDDIIDARNDKHKNEKVKLEEYFATGSTKEKGSSLLVSSIQNINYDLKLSFIRNTKKSKKIILDNRMVQFRSKKLEQSLKEARQND